MARLTSSISQIAEKYHLWKVNLLAALNRENKAVIDFPSNIVRPALKSAFYRTLFNATSNQTYAFYLSSCILVVSYSASMDTSQIYNMSVFCIIAILSGISVSFAITVLIQAILLIKQVSTLWNYLISGIFTSASGAIITYFAVPIVTGMEPILSLASTLAYFCSLFLLWLMIFYNRYPGNLFPVPTVEPSNPDLLMEKLPYAKRGKILYLQAMQHYVNVVTENGEHLLRIKFSDAISNAGEDQGLQIHRSFWIHNHQIDYPFRDGRRWFMKVRSNTFPVTVSVVEEAVSRVEALSISTS